MTGGTVVVLGATGRNFAAGMSGGHAYVWQLDRARVNPELVDLAPLTRRASGHAARRWSQRHLAETGSAVAERAAGATGRRRWPSSPPWCPATTSRVLEIMQAAEAAGRDVDEAVMARSAAAAAPVPPAPRGGCPGGGPCLTRTVSCATTGELPARRPVPVRISDWREVYPPAGEELIREQATRCMDCGIPFCHDGCPLGNRIPDWNDLVRTGDWDAAVESLHATNNFPEFTGRLCPAPCEAACVLGIAGGQPVDHQAGRGGDHQPRPSTRGLSRPGRRRRRTGRRSPSSAPARPAWPPPSSWPGPGTRSRCTSATTRSAACSATASPTSSWRSSTSTARLAQLAAEGVRFRTGVRRRRRRDRRASCAPSTTRCCWPAARCRAGTRPETPGRALRGVHLAMDAPGRGEPGRRRPATAGDGTPIDAAGKHVVIIGGGDTAADCLGVAHRQGAAGVHQLDLYPQPPHDARRGTRPVADLAVGAAQLPGARGGRRAGLRASPCRSSSTTATGQVAGGPDRRGDRGAARRSAGRHRGARAPSGSCRPTWCCWRSASRAPRSGRCWTSSA